MPPCTLKRSLAGTASNPEAFLFGHPSAANSAPCHPERREQCTLSLPKGSQMIREADHLAESRDLLFALR